MPLPDYKQPLEWVRRLSLFHDADLPDLREKNDLYEGTALLSYLHPELLRELGDRLECVLLGWPGLAVDPLEERLDVLGFRYAEESDDDDHDGSKDVELQRIWQDNDLDEESQLGHVDSLVMRRAYIAVGTNEDDEDTPLVTVESPLEVFAEVDPRTRKTLAALRRWHEADTLVTLPTQYATLYLPDATIQYERGPEAWKEVDRDEHKLGEVPIVPLTNRARLAGRYGRSELTPPMVSLANAANKIATDMMVGSEFHAIPLRALFGVGPEELQDEKGNRLSAHQVIMGKLLAVGGVNGNEIKPHQFDPASLTNFHDTLNQLSKHVASLLGLPPHYMGFTTDNPASADAIRSAEARLVKRAERKQRAFGGSWERAMRLVRRFQEGDWDPRAKRLETVWRDASTPTKAQAADAAFKLYTGGIATLRQTREDVGYTPGQIRRMEAEDAAEAKKRAELDPIGTIARGLEPHQPEQEKEPTQAAA